jgi:hypothetical protein
LNKIAASSTSFMAFIVSSYKKAVVNAIGKGFFLPASNFPWIGAMFTALPRQSQILAGCGCGCAAMLKQPSCNWQFSVIINFNNLGLADQDKIRTML